MSRRAADSSAASTGDVPRVFIRCTQIQPVASRAVSISTPAIQPATSSGSQGSTSMGHADRAAGTGAARSRSMRVAVIAMSGFGAGSATAASVAAASGRLTSPVQACQAVTSGIVAMRRSATVATT